MDPVFPVEVFEQVLDYLAERSPGKPFDRTQIDALRSCSLVCKTFSKHCQLLLFERIDEFNPTARCAHSQLSKLQEVFDNNPFNLIEKVHELSIVFNFPDQNRQTPSTTNVNPFSPPYNLLFRFPNVSLLSVKTAHIRVRRAGVNSMASLPRDLIHSYIALHTLHSLVLDYPPELDIILASSSLKSLTLHTLGFMCTQSMSTNRSIAHLKLIDAVVLAAQLPVLSRFAGLEVFDLCNTIASDRLWSADALPWNPTRRLREINIDAGCSGDYMSMLDSMANKDQLLKLQVPLTSAEQWTALTSTLREMHSLRELDLAVVMQDKRATTDDTRFLELIGQDVKTSQHPLTCFTLNVEVRPPVLESYTALMCDIVSFCDALSHCKNVLSRFLINITMRLTRPQRPILELWSTLSETLADPIKFPALRDIDVRIMCCVDNADLRAELLEEFGGEDELRALLSRRMRKIKKRERVRLNVKLSLE